MAAFLTLDTAKALLHTEVDRQVQNKIFHRGDNLLNFAQIKFAKPGVSYEYPQWELTSEASDLTDTGEDIKFGNVSGMKRIIEKCGYTHNLQITGSQLNDYGDASNNKELFVSRISEQMSASLTKYIDSKIILPAIIGKNKVNDGSTGRLTVKDVLPFKDPDSTIAFDWMCADTAAGATTLIADHEKRVGLGLNVKKITKMFSNLIQYGNSMTDIFCLVCSHNQYSVLQADPMLSNFDFSNQKSLMSPMIMPWGGFSIIKPVLNLPTHLAGAANDRVCTYAYAFLASQLAVNTFDPLTTKVGDLPMKYDAIKYSTYGFMGACRNDEKGFGRIECREI